MRYADAVASAPAGSARFRATDLARLSRTTLSLLFEPGPTAPSLEDVAAALGRNPDALVAIASALRPARGERLLRLGRRPVPDAERDLAGRRLVRGSFWTLTYELTPELWQRLATAEPIAPELLSALPVRDARVVEIGAGTGRLTSVLVEQAATLVAVEPSSVMRRVLHDRHPGAHVVGGVGQRLPVRTGWADLVVSCATPLEGQAVRTEFERCARLGGMVALLSPASPSWWRERGYAMREYPAPPVRLDPELEAIFGPARPPHVLLTRCR